MSMMSGVILSSVSIMIICLFICCMIMCVGRCIWCCLWVLGCGICRCSIGSWLSGWLSCVMIILVFI